jgi:alpha-L-arabinofuranosidase
MLNLSISNSSHNYEIVKTFLGFFDRYDTQPRDGYTVYALEYATLTGDYINPNSTGLWDPDEINNRYTYPELRGSVGEFVYALGMERNGDIVKGAAYAPLFHNTPLPRDQLWLPDLISFGQCVRARFVKTSLKLDRRLYYRCFRSCSLN